jgi:hypothetical protein
MANYPMDKSGATIQTDSLDISLTEKFIALLSVPVAAAVVASATGVATGYSLTAATQNKITGITNPAVPKTLSITGNVSGITGSVVLTGTNYNKEVITEAISLSGTATVAGAKAFRTVANVALPVQVHTAVLQVNTATVIGTCTQSGNATVVVTAAGMTGTPKTYNVAVLNNDTASQMAAKIITALAADAALTALYAVSGTGATVVLTAIVPAANDATLNISTANGTCLGVTTAASSVATTAGVVADVVSIGFTEVLGLPCKFTRNSVERVSLNYVLEATAPTVTVSSTALESNTMKLNSTLNGSVVDAYLII